MFCTEVHTFLSHLIILKETLWASNYVQDSSFDICWSNKPKTQKYATWQVRFSPYQKAHWTTMFMMHGILRSQWYCGFTDHAQVLHDALILSPLPFFHFMVKAEFSLLNLWEYHLGKFRLPNYVKINYFWNAWDFGSNFSKE